MKRCDHCGEYFQPKYANSKLCYPCWKKRETAFRQYDYLVGLVDRLESQLYKRSSEQAIPPDMLKKLILLSHPDKHDNSRTANEVTQWLLSRR